MRAVLILAVLAPALAGAAEPQQFVFAIPGKESRISLGVFDGGGRLVRTLFAAARENSFRAEVNGLAASWDGKDDAGQLLPAGKYHVRGWAAGNGVKSEGVAYHFNDWITSDETPRISGIGAVIPAGRDTLLLYGFRPAREGLIDVVLLRFAEAAGLTALTSLPPKARFLAGEPGRVAVNDRDLASLLVYDLKDPATPLVSGEGTSTFWCGAFWKERLCLLPESGKASEVEVRGLPALGSEGTIAMPARFRGLDANEAALMGWDAAGVWICRAAAFEAADIRNLPTGFSVSAGPGETCWVAGREGDAIVVRQYAFAGELLREMKIAEEFAESVEIFASKASLEFYLLLRAPQWSRQTLRGYRPALSPPTPVEGGEARVDWEVFLDRTIENSRRFGLVDGRLVANAGDRPQSTEQTVKLSPEALDGEPGTATLKGVSRADGLWLESSGLPVIPVADVRGYDRIVVSKGPAGQSLRLYAGNGIVVAEYLISGLEDLVALDAGEIDLP